MLMNICLVADDNFTEYVYLLIFSVLYNSNKDDNFVFHIIDLDIKESNKYILEELKEVKKFELKFYKPINIEKYKKWDEYFKKHNKVYKWNYSIFLKLEIPILLKDVDKVLYLDSDQVILCSLDKAFKINITNYYMLVLQASQHSCSFLYTEEFSFIRKMLEEIGLSAKYYIFGGFMIFNIKHILDKIGIDMYYKAIDDCFNMYKDYIFTEEHVLSYIFKKEVAYIDNNFDINSSWPAKYDSKIFDLIHYGGRTFPLSLNYNFFLPENEYVILWEYFNRTKLFNNNIFTYNYVFWSNIFKYKSIEYKNNIENLNDIIINRDIECRHNIEKLYKSIKKLIDIIVWFIPIKIIRDKLREKIIKKIEL